MSKGQSRAKPREKSRGRCRDYPLVGVVPTFGRREAPRIQQFASASKDDDIVHAHSNVGITCKELVPGSSPGAGAEG